MGPRASERRYYVDQYSDEIVPCDCTLDGWAEWLAKDVRGEWGRTGPIPSGTELSASVLLFLGDVEVTRLTEKSFSFEPGLPENFEFAAMRFGKGLGWDAESILNPDELHDGLLGYGSEYCVLLEVGESGWLALGVWEPRLRLRFELHEGGTGTLSILEMVQ